MSTWTVTVTVAVPDGMDDHPAVVLASIVLGALEETDLRAPRIAIEEEK